MTSLLLRRVLQKGGPGSSQSGLEARSLGKGIGEGSLRELRPDGGAGTGQAKDVPGVGDACAFLSLH